MKFKCYLPTLALCVLILRTGVRAEQKWSWGKDEGHSRRATPSVSARTSSLATTVLSTRDISHETTTKDSVEDVQTPAIPQGRSFGLFKKFGCDLGLCKKDKYKHKGGQPIFPGPIPYAPSLGPQYTPGLPIGPGVPIISSKPIAVASPSGVYYPPPTVVKPYPPPTVVKPYPPPTVVKPYPPIKPQPVKEEHHHHHTHIHENNLGSHSESPYKLTGYPPKKTGFAPTVIHGDSHETFGPTVGTGPYSLGSRPIGAVPEAVTGTLYRPTHSLYQEECHCVLPHQCSPYDIVRKSSGKDIAYLVNPRNEHSSVLSNQTNYSSPKRSKRDVTNRQPVSSTSHTPKGRAIGGYSPGLTGCGHNYVCCRSGVNEPKHFNNICGRSLKSSIHGRIANTDYNKGATQFGEYPWQGSILRDENYESVFACGATLVSPQHVLTAAHCIEKEPVHALKIRLGDWDVNSEKEFYKHVELPVQKIIIHPKYYAGNLENDLAIITLQGYIDFNVNPHIAPVCLPNAYTDFTHQHCYVSGWGKDAFGYSGEFQQILKKVDVPIVDRQTCQYALQQARLGSDYHLPEGFICAGGQEGKDTCKGDGGGPLVCPTSYNTFELAGIVSWGIGCGLRGVPGVYVNIPYYVDWIKSNVDYF